MLWFAFREKKETVLFLSLLDVKNYVSLLNEPLPFLFLFLFLAASLSLDRTSSQDFMPRWHPVKPMET